MAHAIVAEKRARVQRLPAINIEAEKPKMAPDALAEIVLSFFSGSCIERNKSGEAESTPLIASARLPPDMQQN